MNLESSQTLEHHCSIIQDIESICKEFTTVCLQHELSRKPVAREDPIQTMLQVQPGHEQLVSRNSQDHHQHSAPVSGLARVWKTVWLNVAERTTTKLLGSNQ